MGCITHLALLYKVNILDGVESILDAALLVVCVLCTLQLEHLGLPQDVLVQVRVQSIIISRLKILQETLKTL